VLPRSRFPVLPPPGRFVMFRARHRPLCDRPQAATGSGHRPPPLRPRQRSNSDYAGGTYSGEIGVSIETQELRLSSRECDFPGINIPDIDTLLLHTTNRKYHMAYLFIPFSVTLDDLEGHSLNAGLIICNLTNICVTLARF